MFADKYREREKGIGLHTASTGEEVVLFWAGYSRVRSGASWDDKCSKCNDNYMQAVTMIIS